MPRIAAEIATRLLSAGRLEEAWQTSYDEYVADEMVSAAVERQFEIIGEALVRLRRTAPDVSAMIPDVSEIIGFRNVLVHDYENSISDVFG